MDDDVSTDSRDTRINALASTAEKERGLGRAEVRDPEVTALVKLLEERLPMLAPRELTPVEIIAEQRGYITQLEWGIGIVGFLFLMMLLARR